MVESLKRLREPLAWLLVALVSAGLGLGIAGVAVGVGQGMTLAEAALEQGPSLVNLPVVIVLVAVVCTCFFVSPALRRARLITVVAAVVVSLGVAATLVLAVLGSLAGGGALGTVMVVLGALLDGVLKLLAAVVLWVLLRGVRDGHLDVARTAAELAQGSTEPDPSPAPPGAVGTAWRTAAEAAAGLPGQPAPATGDEPRPEWVGRPAEAGGPEARAGSD